MTWMIFRIYGYMCVVTIDGLDVFRCLVRQKESEIVKVACGHSSFIHGSHAIQISYVKTAPRKKMFICRWEKRTSKPMESVTIGNINLN
jgi:hypothetical protein